MGTLENNSRNIQKGYTPLHICAIRGIKEGVQALIEAGADLNAVTTAGKTASSFASDWLLENLDKFSDYMDIMTMTQPSSSQ